MLSVIFPEKMFFLPKKQKKTKFPYNFFQNPKFSKFSNNPRISCRTLPRHLACPISDWYVCLANIQPKNRIRWWLIFKTAILSISRRHTGIKKTFLESWDQTGSETHIFLFKNTNSKIWPYATRGWPTFSVKTCMKSDCRTASIFEFCLKSDYKSCGACLKKNFWFWWWPFVPFRGLTLTLTRT